MDLPNCWLLLALLVGVNVLCQDYDDAYESNYSENDAEVLLPPPLEYMDIYAPYPLGCAPECFCPPSYPYAMYCNNRKLRAIPAIPRHIRHLYIQSNDIEALAAEPFANATSLTDINLSHNSLKSPLVDRKALAKLKSLLHLHLDYNQLEEVPPSLPKTLHQLSLGFNKISKLSVDAMQGLAGIAVLDLCNNRLTDAGIKGKVLSGMKSLMQISMCGNRLKSMPSELPASLILLSLDNNSISSIPEGYFKKTPNLLSLRMSYNKLKAVPYKVFNLSSLTELNLGHNQLSRAFYVPRALQHLYLNDNEFLNLNVSLMCSSLDQDNPNLLTYIRIDNNRLKRAIDYYIYACFPRIQTIFYGEQKAEKKPPPTTKKGPPPPKKASPRLKGDKENNDGDAE
ncbi:osteomodulin [Anguilla anguilla]|uniref:osteomodulin n=1 Tax=Anguilla anguilla TaxID=7936 RepID=UPI0015AA6A46|nr:osteomodulin [Anguilla anguilla]XP_035245244.1 osteomodulin [Anguilla anguilla]